MRKWKCEVTYRWQPPPDYPKPVQTLGTGGNGSTVVLNFKATTPPDAALSGGDPQ
jgi:hypothetical protein